ncbi:MAG: hypothetical protein CMA27_05890 [Euryarchaeota archaeon]|nr:hypothetical protein [Euryarchaeota archaeon]
MGKALIGLGVIILVIAFLGRMDYTVYESTEEISMPPMASATGWQLLPIPDVMGVVDLEVTAEWEGVYWVGVTSKEEAQRCDPDPETKVSLTCSGNDIDFEIGGPNTVDSSINWKVESGEWYAAVGQSSGSFTQVSTLSVNLQATASLNAQTFSILLGISGGTMLLGLLLNRR